MSEVRIYAEDGVTVADQCRGATWAGGCPRAQPDTLVPCAGHKIVVPIDAAGIRELALIVELDATTCPLAALDLGAIVGQRNPA